MPVKTFKATLYDVRAGESNEPLADDSLEMAIKAASSTGLAERTRQVNDKVRRLENHALSKDFWLLNFVTGEYSGPGRTAVGTPTEPIQLESDEHFAHETAMLYDPREQIVLLESGLSGVGPGVATQYLASFVEAPTFRLVPCFDEDASAKARSFNEIRRAVFRFVIGPPSAKDKEMGMGAVNAFATPLRGAEVDIVVKAERSKSSSLSLSHLRSIISNLTGSREDHHVNVFKVYGRENEDDDLEEVNLFLPTVKFEKSLQVDDTARKVKHENRWDALMEFHGELVR